jgi:thiamine pyrophosphokinase
VYQTIIIVSGGALVDRDYFYKIIRKTKKRHIICCDGGARHLEQSAIIPDVIIGDMDSIDDQQLEKYFRKGTKIIRYPENKDLTDTELALDYAMNLKPEAIFIWAASGGRLDHTLANVFLLRKAKQKGIRTYLADEYCEAFLSDKEEFFINQKGQTVSILALSSRVTGICLSGFLYPLKMASMKMGESRGISNIIQNERASLRFEKGSLLVVKYRRKNSFPETL